MANTLELILDDTYKLDFDDSTEIGLVYQISDIREYEKRKSSFSYPFTLPGSHNNNEAFGYIYNVQSETQFDPNKKVKIVVQINANIIFTGFLQLNNVNLVNDPTSGKYSYNVTAYSQFTTLFDVISDKSLCDLDLSEFDHIYNYDNIVASWDRYVMRSGIQSSFKKGMGYVYPYADYNTRDGRNLIPVFSGPTPSAYNQSDIVINTEFFLPHPYVKTIWDRIFLESGFSYTSEFLSTDTFKSLIVSPNPDGIAVTDSLAEQVDFKAKQNFVEDWGLLLNDLSGQDWMLLPGYGDIYQYNYDTVWSAGDNPEYYDPYDNFDITTHIYTVPFKCHMDFDAELKFRVTYGTDDYNCGVVGGPWICKGTEKLYGWLIVLRNGVEIVIDSLVWQTPVQFGYVTNCSKFFLRSFNLSCTNFQFYAGDQIYVKKNCSFNGLTTNTLGQELNSRIHFEVRQANFGGKIVNQTIEEGNPVDFSALMYCNSQSEFLTSIIRMFNLYVTPDPDNANNIFIEPRDVFYNSDSAIDWTQKLDRSQQWTLTPIPEVNSSNLDFKYKSDSDELNTNYQDSFKDDTYGSYTSESINKWKTTTDVVELIFSPSPLTKEENSDRFLVDIYKIQGNKKSFTNWNIRILYYNGLVTTANQWVFNSSDRISAFSYYPYAGHMDSPENTPTVDINWFFAKRYYYDRTQATPNNLYNLYWKNQIDNIFDPNAKMLRGEFELTEYDIQTLDLSTYIYLDGLYWIINKIDGYDPIGTNLTTVELITIINIPTIRNFGLENVPITGLQPGGTHQSFAMKIGPSDVPAITQEIMHTKNADYSLSSLVGKNSGGNFISGRGNIIHNGMDSNVVLGSGNELGTNYASLIIGDDNKITQYNKSILLVDDFDGFTSSQGEGMLVFGNTQSGYSSISFLNLIDNSNSITDGPSASIPMFTPNGLTSSGLYFTGSYLTNGSFLLTPEGELSLGLLTSPYTNKLSINSQTQSKFFINSSSSGNEIGSIVWGNGSPYNSIEGFTDGFNFNSYDTMKFSVNTVDTMTINPGRVEILGTYSTGLVLSSPNNTRFLISISDSGIISATSI